MRTTGDEDGLEDRDPMGRRSLWLEDRNPMGHRSPSWRATEGGAPAGPFAWYVDGMNVLGARPDGWWRDRAGAVWRLSAELERFARCRGERVLVVFDGYAPAPRAERREASRHPDGLFEARFAPGGPDAADKLLAAMLIELDGPRDRVALVSSDQALVSAGRAAGVATMGAASFLRMLASALGTGPSHPRPGHG